MLMILKEITFSKKYLLTMKLMNREKWQRSKSNPIENRKKEQTLYRCLESNKTYSINKRNKFNRSHNNTLSFETSINFHLST